MQSEIYQLLSERKRNQRRQIALLIDPDKVENCAELVKNADKSGVDLFLVGGSLIYKGNIQTTIQMIKAHTSKPVIIFPGSNLHISSAADAILLLFLASGRNPEYLIGQHVISAFSLVQSGLEVMSTGYLLVNGGNQTTVSYISDTTPIPREKPEIAAATALACQLLGMKLIYLDCGSGAKHPVSADMIKIVSQSVQIPIVVGGGMRSATNVLEAWQAGADVCVVGTAMEENPISIFDMMKTLNEARSLVVVQS